MYITHALFLYVLCAPKFFSYVLFILFKKIQFFSRKRKEAIGAVPVTCSSVSCLAIQVCGVSCPFQAAVGCGSAKHGCVLGAQAKSKSGLAPPVCGIVL